MKLWAIIPIKSISKGKSRLSGVMSEEDREILNLTMLQNTLSVISNIHNIDNIIVISKDFEALNISKKYGAVGMVETGSPDLNTALTQATSYAQKNAIPGIIILPSDLPLLNNYDLIRFIDVSRLPYNMVISPDRHWCGTNALMLKPPGVIKYQFGADSFKKHINQADDYGISYRIMAIPYLQLDLDNPEDLDSYNKSAKLEVSEREKADG